MNPETSANTSQPLPLPARPRRRWLSVLIAIGIFAAGFGCGAGWFAVRAIHHLQYAIHHPESAPARIAAVLGRRLKLDESQKKQVEQIVAKRQIELLEIRRQFQPLVTEKLDEVRDEVGGVLTNQQRAEWIKLFDGLRDRWLPTMPPAEEKSQS